MQRQIVNHRRTALPAVLILLSAILQPSAKGANQYVQHNLASDVPGLADQTDPNLVNPWGISMSSTSPFWISNNHSGVTSVYDGQGKPAPTANPIVVKIPVPSGGNPPAAPTGQVFNDTQGFVVNGKPAPFIFVTEDGTISAWSPSADPANAILMVDNSAAGAVYKGVALANTSNGPMLYAANFNAATIDVFDGNFSPVISAGAFTDPNLPAGFAPFNVQRIGRKLYVTYAMQDAAKHDDVAGAGNGFVDVFDVAGNLVTRLVSNGSLNSPWGLALAPGNFGDFSNVLLVGNFGDGVINAFDPCSGEYLGTLQDGSGAKIIISGLWGLSFGNGRGAGDATTLYFTAGIAGSGNVEDHGLFGSIAIAPASPPPSSQPTAANINNFAFMPPILTIGAGTQVQWTNQDAAAHTVVADDASFRSNGLQRNETFSQAFSTPGTYSYHCSIHPFMKGKIIVQ
jgi:uncharacterized protein (TIGR03118 family)